MGSISGTSPNVGGMPGSPGRAARGSMFGGVSSVGVKSTGLPFPAEPVGDCTYPPPPQVDKEC